MKPCLSTDCKATARVRGLCHGCYEKAHRAIKAGITTWEELERLALAEPSKRPRTGQKNSFVHLIEARRAASR